MPAGPVAHLQLKTSQRYWHGTSGGQLGQCRACLEAPILAASTVTSKVGGMPGRSTPLIRRLDFDKP